jgi:hypothetical protein
MNKAVTPEQLELVEELSRDALQTAAHEITERISAQLVPKLVEQPEPYDDFNWATDPTVVLHEQRATAIYRNRIDGIVIRQERNWDEESDPFMVITEENLVTFMEAFAKRARE